MNWIFEHSIPLTSLFVSGCALYITIKQAKQNYKHNKLSVRPFLSANMYSDVKNDIGFFTIELMNCGVGPAIIKDFILFFDGKEISSKDASKYHAILNKKLAKFKSVYPYCYVPGAVMHPNEIQSILKVEYSSKNPFVFSKYKLYVLVNYQSIYQDEVFTFDTRGKINNFVATDRDCFSSHL